MTSPPDSAVEAHVLTLAYGEHLAVRDASFSLRTGTVTAVIGPNGSGKTTLLRAISGLQPQASGSLTVLGRRPGGARDVAHVMQSTRVNDAVPLTVLEVVRMGRYARRGAIGRLRRKDHAAVEQAMERMDIHDISDRHLVELSGGQRQRVYVAQGLAEDASVLLLDEPLTGLDLPSQDRITETVRDEAARGHTVVLTTHDVAAAAQADHVLLLATHLVASGTPEQVLTEEHLGHAYGGRAFRTAEGALVIGDPHVHGHQVEGHERH